MWIPQLPAALWWEHNAFYQRWLLRRLPARVDRALDVGCGHGVLALGLVDRTRHVDAVDVSATMIERARALSTRVNWVLGDVLDDTLPLDPRGYDLVTAVSSLHHLPLHAGLRRMAGLVAPGGLLVVIGMYDQVTIADHGIEALALPANAAMGAVLAASGRAGKPNNVDMPIRPPTDTLADITAAVAEIVPGALVRRRLFWRYTLLWRRSTR